MGTAISVWADYSSKDVRRLAARAKDAGQVQRLPAMAAVLDGGSREEAAKIGEMDRHTLRDWVIGSTNRDRHGAKILKVPSNVTLMPRAPELNGQENIWQFIRRSESQ